MENSLYPDQYGRRGSRHGLSIRCPRRCQKGGTTASCRNESGVSGGACRKGLPVCAAPLRAVFPGCSLDRCCSVLASRSTGSCTMHNAQAAASTGVVTHQPDELAQPVFKSCDIFMDILLRGACLKSQAYDRCAFISSGQEMKSFYISLYDKKLTCLAPTSAFPRLLHPSLHDLSPPRRLRHLLTHDNNCGLFASQRPPHSQMLALNKSSSSSSPP